MAELKQVMSVHAGEDYDRQSDSDSDSDGGLVRSEDSAESVGDSQDYPAMAWDDHSKSKGLTTAAATVSMITACVGAGIMALPQLPKSTGLFPILIMTFFSSLMILESVQCFFKGYICWNNNHPEDPLRTFEDFGKAAYGAPGAILVRVIQIGWFMGAASGYVILISEQLEAIGSSGGLDWSPHQWILALAPVLIFLSLLRDVSALAKLMPIGAIAAVATCGLIALQASRDVDVWEAWPQEDQEKVHSLWAEHGAMPMGSALATLFGAFGVMGNVPPVLDEMRKKKRLPTALRNSMGFVTVLYFTVIVLGYWAYGNFIQPNIVLSMSRSPANLTEAMNLPAKLWTGNQNRMLPQIMSACVLTNLVMSYPLILMCVFVSIQGTSCGRKHLVPGTAANYALRIGLVGTTLAIAATVSRFDVLFSLFASICGPIQSTMIPIIFSAKIRALCGAKGPSKLRWFIHSLILVISLFCMVDGFVDSLNNLIASMK